MTAEEDATKKLASTGHLDMETFGQILEMDEPGDCEFSRSIVFDFFDQVEETFEQIQKALDDKDLEQLSAHGHFLKGSSATLGLSKVRDSCEKIQRWGKKETESGDPLDDEDECLKLIEKVFQTVKEEYSEAEQALRDFYEALEA